MLIANAEIYGKGTTDLRIRRGRIAEIGALTPHADERVLNAFGGALLPGLADHHVHLLSFAASLDSVACGPPDVTTGDALSATLQAHRPVDGWIRGVGYHESVAGDIDRWWLDRSVRDVPVRIQHRSGRLWILNSAALDRIADRTGDGRLYDQDAWLGARIGTTPPPIRKASERLASYGVTGVSDMTHRNTQETLALFGDLQRDGRLLQRVSVAGTLALDAGFTSERLCVGATKVHLHEASLPPFAELCRIIRASHANNRTVAIHCVTEAELVYALAAFREASPRAGDRIEHASVTPPHLLDQLSELQLVVVTQPNFVAERGAAYARDLPADTHAALYRCRSFLARGIPLAGATDAPFGDADPWKAMRAAVSRQTADGALLGPDERLTPEEALALFLGALEAPPEPRRVMVGADADLCLLDRPWARARTELSSNSVRATLRAGELIFDRVDQPPR